MRKGVIFFISILFLMSIVIVSFFGMQARLDQFKTYITSVEITNYDRVVGNRKYKYVDWVGPIDTFTTVEYKVKPDEQGLLESVEFTITNNTYVDEEGNEQEFAQINKTTGIVEFYLYLESSHVVTITIRATDGSNKSDSVTIILFNQI